MLLIVAPSSKNRTQREQNQGGPINNFFSSTRETWIFKKYGPTSTTSVEQQLILILLRSLFLLRSSFRTHSSDEIAFHLMQTFSFGHGSLLEDRWSSSVTTARSRNFKNPTKKISCHAGLFIRADLWLMIVRSEFCPWQTPVECNRTTKINFYSFGVQIS